MKNMDNLKDMVQSAMLSDNVTSNVFTNEITIGDIKQTKKAFWDLNADSVEYGYNWLKVVIEADDELFELNRDATGIIIPTTAIETFKIRDKEIAIVGTFGLTEKINKGKDRRRDKGIVPTDLILLKHAFNTLFYLFVEQDIPVILHDFNLVTTEDCAEKVCEMLTAFFEFSSGYRSIEFEYFVLSEVAGE